MIPWTVQWTFYFYNWSEVSILSPPSLLEVKYRFKDERIRGDTIDIGKLREFIRPIPRGKGMSLVIFSLFYDAYID